MTKLDRIENILDVNEAQGARCPLPAIDCRWLIGRLREFEWAVVAENEDAILAAYKTLTEPVRIGE